MRVEVIMPKMGESIQEGTVLRWLKKKGERVEKDELLLEISTDKVDSEIPSPVSGILQEILVQELETVPVGTIIAYIETEEGEHHHEVHIQHQTDVTPVVSKNDTAKPVTRKKEIVEGKKFYSPLVRYIASHEHVSESELAMLRGTGAMGRVTKNDLLAYMEIRNHLVSSSAPSPQHQKLIPLPMEELEKKYPPPLHRIVPMDGVQIKMAEHMSRSVATSPHVTLIDEVDVTNILLFRKQCEEDFQRHHGFRLTLTPFFVYSTVAALKANPLLNSVVEGTAIVFREYINVGIATATPQGLLVPVVKSAHEKNFLGLAEAIYDLIRKAKEKKLSPDDLSGGTFSITNYGVFGNLIGTPILNQPQVGILGIGAVKRRPMVMTENDGTESIQIRSCAYITLTFDHRIVDGATGGRFLTQVKNSIEQFDVTEVQK